MRTLGLLLAAAVLAHPQQHEHSFKTAHPAEVVVEISMRSPGADWAARGREAAVASITLDSRPAVHQMLYAGPDAYTYRVFLGRVPAGPHELRIERDAQKSAPGTDLAIDNVAVRTFAPGSPEFLMLRHAPVIYPRTDAKDRFTDIPLIGYCERIRPDTLEYTIVFSNEDGGTSTRALMARWGRTVDIEFVYRVRVGASGERLEAIIQGKDHAEIPYNGPFEEDHPLLGVITHNNMVGPAEPGPIRYQPAPSLVDLSASSREAVLDRDPLLYRVMSQELRREAKLRPFGVVAGENISDPANYAYVEFKSSHQNSAFNVHVTLSDGRAFSSDLGRLDLAITRDGWVRVAVELPPGTRTADIASLGFGCIVPPPRQKGGALAHSGACSLQGVNKLFLLTPEFRAGPAKFVRTRGYTVPTGQAVVFRDGK